MKAEYQDIPTVCASENFDPCKDVDELIEAIKGFGTDEDKILLLLTRRSASQRQAICFKYKVECGQSLIEVMKKELSGHLEDLVVALLTPPVDYLAQELHCAMSGPGTNEKTLVEILCSQNNAGINDIKIAYKRLYHKSLEEDIRSDTSGHFRSLLVSICTACRDEETCSKTKATALAKELYAAGEKKLGTDEAVFNRILATCSYPLLCCIFEEYKRMYKVSFKEALEDEFSGDQLMALLAICCYIEDKYGFFAGEIHDCLKWSSFEKDKALIRLIVSRCEIDLENIKTTFQDKYGKTLLEEVEGGISTHFKKGLASLIEGCC